MRSGYDAVKAFRFEKGKEWDQTWADVIKAAYDLSSETSEFAGSWVQNRVEKWFPSLRSPASFGILEKTDSARGGRRAYYRMPDREGVARALKEFGVLK